LSITGASIQCPSQTGLVYSVAAVTNATNYTWSLPAGWSITSGQGTNTIIVNSGDAGQNGNIAVTASNDCGTSKAQQLAVSITDISITTELKKDISLYGAADGEIDISVKGGTPRYCPTWTRRV